MTAPALWESRLRPMLARSAALRRVRRAGLVLAGRPVPDSFWEMPPDQALRVAYNVLLRRDPDPAGAATYLPDVASGALTRDDLVDRLRTSDEHRVLVPLGPNAMLTSLHLSRCEFIIGLPPARRILDLGGSHAHVAWGSLITMGYPYDFDELVIVDLHPDDRHEEFHSEVHGDTMSPRGPVRYAYHSMTDLSPYGDASFDLVYSGQSIEHVTEAEADGVLAEIHRVLRPGGFLALDTPNARACRMQQEELINPDHEVEYTHEELAGKLEQAGFVIEEAKGLNYLGRSLAEGKVSEAETAANYGVYRSPRDCYLLAYVCRRP